MTLEGKPSELSDNQVDRLAIVLRCFYGNRVLVDLLLAVLCGFGAACMIMGDCDKAILSHDDTIIKAAYDELSQHFRIMWVMLLVALAGSVISIIRQRTADVFKNHWFWYLVTPYPATQFLRIAHLWMSVETMLKIERGVCWLILGILLCLVVGNFIIVKFGKRILVKLSKL